MMEPLILLGSGGHAKVVIEILEDMGAYEIVGCTTSAVAESSLLDVPILGDDSCLPNLFASGIRKAFIAVGSNRVRHHLSYIACKVGFEIVNVISPYAVVSRRVELCQGIAIMAGAVINSCSRVGSGTIVNTGATVDHECTIGRWAHLGPGTNLCGSVSVGEGAFLGVGVHVMPKISIGAWTTIGAGAVVVRDMPAGVTAMGVPAEIRLKDKER